MHSKAIHVLDVLIVLVFAYELFKVSNRLFIVVVLPLGRTLGTTTSPDFFIIVHLLFSATYLLFCLL